MEIIGENVDRAITIELRATWHPQRGITRRLYEKAREKAGTQSLTLLAAQKLIASAKTGDNVLIVTGVGRPPHLPHGETDGPLGAASLARAVSYGWGVKPILVVGAPDAEPVRVTVKAAGINIEDYDTYRQINYTGAMTVFTCDGTKASQLAKEILDKYNPKAIVSIEAAGLNKEGVFHSSRGKAQNIAVEPKYYTLFDEARERGILTISCIDIGNEVGSGTIEEAVREITRWGDVCQCPCGGGLACVTKADIVIPAACSNWGAYGISAMLALLLKNPEVLHNSDTERRMLEANIMAGSIDGSTQKPDLLVDGMSCETGQGLVNILHMIVENGLKTKVWERDH